MFDSFFTWNKSLDWTDFSDPVSSFDLIANTVRMANQFDYYDGTDTFLAVALTTASPMNSAEAGMGPGSARSAKYFFKARIIGENSPHSFLPDPCLLSQAGNTEAAINAIHQHTTFFGIIDYTGGLARTINPGDIVEVQLEKEAFSYNLEKGEFLELVSMSTAQVADAGCINMASVFGALSPFGADGGPAPDGGMHSRSRPANDQTPETICGLTPVSRLDAEVGRYNSTLNPVGVVLHYTAGGSTASGIKVLGMRGLSYHFIISRGGQITQLVKSNMKAIHDPTTNATHIGIAFVNLGYQEKYAGKYGSPDLSQWVKSGSKLWEPYPATQIAATQRLIKALKCKYPAITDIKLHSETSTSGKHDAGPAFPVSKFR